MTSLDRQMAALEQRAKSIVASFRGYTDPVFDEASGKGVDSFVQIAPVSQSAGTLFHFIVLSTRAALPQRLLRYLRRQLIHISIKDVVEGEAPWARAIHGS